MNIEVEIVDENLDYNLLLGRNWIYEMDSIVSSLFRILCFPHEGRIVRVDQLHYSPGDSHTTSNSTVPLVDNPRQHIENLGVRMNSSLTGIFDLLAPTARINVISSSRGPSQKEFFRTRYFLDPWPLPSSTTTLDGGQVGGMEFPMFTIELTYQSIVNSADNHPTPFSLEELDGDVAPTWTLDSTSALDWLDTILPLEEAILYQ